MTRDALGFDHPAWLTAGATAGAYLLVLGVMVVVLFVIPFVLFALF